MQGAISPTLDIVLLVTEWRPRALLRAQLIEEGFEVLAVDSWAAARPHFRLGSKPRLVIVDLQELPEPERVLAELSVLMTPPRVLILSAAATVEPDDVARLGFRRLTRPVSIENIVAAATEAIHDQGPGKEKA